MVTVRLKGIHSVHAKGHPYYYAWRGGPRLHGEPGSQEFLASYKAATDTIANLDRSLFSTWVALYRSSDEFRKNAASTREEWSKWLDRINDHFGDLSLGQFDRAAFRVDIRKWRDKWKHAPRTADYGKQVLSRVLSYAVAEGKLILNICHEIPNLYSVDRSDVIWEDSHLARLLECNKVSAEIKWAGRLAKLTGFRRADLLTVSWTYVEQYAIEVRTQKSRAKRRATAPITRELRDLLDEIPKRATTILTSSKGCPWTPDGFGSSWWKALENAGLHGNGLDLHLHDLRGTFATFIYRAGFSSREIADTLGWTEDRVDRLIDCYVRREDILKDKIQRLEAGGKSK